MQKQRRSVWHWLAKKAGLDIKLTRDEWMAAYRLGATNRIEHPGWMSQADYREMLAEHARVAYEYLVRGHRHSQPELTVTTYGPPQQQTDPTAQQKPFNPTLDKFVHTQSLPIIRGEWLRKRTAIKRETGHWPEDEEQGKSG